MTAPIPADETIQELAIAHGNIDTARACAADCLRDLACELQDTGHTTQAILVFAARGSLAEAWRIQGTLTTVIEIEKRHISMISPRIAERTHKALTNLLAALACEKLDEPYAS